MKKRNIIDDISIKMMSTELNGVPDYRDEELLKQIKALPDIHQKGRDGRTLLIHTALYNRLDIMKWLLKHGADIEAQCDMGLTALHCAVISNNYVIAEYLLKSGANINARDNIGNTPLMRASLNEDIIKLLASYGADATLANRNGISPIKKYEAYPAILTILNN